MCRSLGKGGAKLFTHDMAYYALTAATCSIDASTRDPPPLDLRHLRVCDPKQGTAGPGWDCRPGAIHPAKKRGESPGNRPVCRVSYTDFFCRANFFF